MYLMVALNGFIFQRKEISGWYKFPTTHAANLRYTDATMLYDGSILAISAAGYAPLVAGRLHLLATPTGPAEIIDPNLGSAPVSVATLLDGTILLLTAAGTLHQAPFVRGPWQQIALPPAIAAPADITVTLDGHVLCLDGAGAIHQAAVAGAPAPGALWAIMPAPALANVTRIEFLRDGSLIAIDNANAPHLLPANQIQAHGVWQALQHTGPVLSVTPLGGHTLLAIDPGDHRLLTADALPENWVQVANQPPSLAIAVAHLRTGHIAALCADGQIYRAPFAPANPGGPPVVGVFVPSIAPLPPAQGISLATTPGGKIMVVGNDHQLYTWEIVSPPNQAVQYAWVLLNTGPTRFCSVTVLADGVTMYGIGQNQTDRLLCRPDATSAYGQTAPWLLIGPGPAATSTVRIRDGSFLEVAVAGNALSRKVRPQDPLIPCGWAGPCQQVIELASDPADTTERPAKWLLQFSSRIQGGTLGDGRPWGDGTRMAQRAAAGLNPWDAGSRVTPLIGGFAALSAMRDAFEAAIIEATASPSAPGQRGYVYIADWLLTPLRDLSEDNPWGGASWGHVQPAPRDQTAIGLIARMMSAGIKVRILVWMPTSTQSVKAGALARQHWHLARMVRLLNQQLKTQGPAWANVDTGIVALDLRTANVTSASLHQKMCVVRVGDVNVGFCGGVDLAYTRRDFRRPANAILGTGDWQSGDTPPAVSGNWPKQNPAPASGYPALVAHDDEDDITDELGANVYGLLRHWHDQHLKLEGPVVTSLEEQFDERWRMPGRPFLFNPSSSYGSDNQVQFTSASAFNGQVIGALDVTACAPAGSAVVQLWRTIPADDRRKGKGLFARGEFTVMAGISKAVQQATQLITIWDQYLWSEPFCLLLAERMRRAPDLKVLIVLPPYGSNDPPNELRYRKRTVQTLWNALAPNDRARLVVRNAWANNIGVYVHAKVQTYDDCLLVCGSANLNRRSFTCDMELDCAVLHKPDVSYHLANLAHMITGLPWTDFGHGWLQRYWAYITGNAAQTTIADPFYCLSANIGQATPNHVQYNPGGAVPDWAMEPNPFSADIETVDPAGFQNSVGTTGRLDFLVWLLENYQDKGVSVYRASK
jgi:phosphatidylserine/phosphatidylglycerophosphate/cardiolipin synthase-like enzyme